MMEIRRALDSDFDGSRLGPVDAYVMYRFF